MTRRLRLGGGVREGEGFGLGFGFGAPWGSGSGRGFEAIEFGFGFTHPLPFLRHSVDVHLELVQPALQLLRRRLLHLELAADLQLARAKFLDI